MARSGPSDWGRRSPGPREHSGPAAVVVRLNPAPPTAAPASRRGLEPGRRGCQGLGAHGSALARLAAAGRLRQGPGLAARGAPGGIAGLVLDAGAAPGGKTRSRRVGGKAAGSWAPKRHRGGSGARCPGPEAGSTKASLVGPDALRPPFRGPFAVLSDARERHGHAGRTPITVLSLAAVLRRPDSARALLSAPAVKQGGRLYTQLFHDGKKARRVEGFVMTRPLSSRTPCQPWAAPFARLAAPCPRGRRRTASAWPRHRLGRGRLGESAL